MTMKCTELFHFVTVLPSSIITHLIIIGELIDKSFFFMIQILILLFTLFFLIN